jgi:hypothetical protein
VRDASTYPRHPSGPLPVRQASSYPGHPSGPLPVRQAGMYPGHPSGPLPVRQPGASPRQAADHPAYPAGEDPALKSAVWERLAHNAARSAARPTSGLGELHVGQRGPRPGMFSQ